MKPPAAIAQRLQEGLTHHRAGRLPEAEAAYRRALAIDPDNPDALHFLGVLAHQVGRNDFAMEFIRRAIAHAGGRADFHSNLGLVLNAMGDHARAEYALRSALRLKPDYPDALNNLGLALTALGRPEEAEASYREAIRLQPGFAGALNNLGLTLSGLGRPAEAAESHRAAIAADPNMAEAHANLGLASAALGRTAQAEASYRAALSLRPDFPDALNNLGVLLSDLGRWHEAEATLREGLGLAPGSADMRGNLAVVLTHQRRAAESEALLTEAIAAAPNKAELHYNMGASQAAQLRDADAATSYRTAIGLRPDFADAHTDLAYALLRSGDYSDGWREYEWRWRGKHLRGGARGFAQSQWAGEALGERVLLLHAEQGLGDTLQFCRYAPLIAGRVVLEVQGPLKRLLSDLPGIERVLAQGEALPAFDLHTPLMSLPLAFGTTLGCVPADSYLAAGSVAAAAWRERLKGLPGQRVGLVWAGQARPGFPELAATDARRSMALAEMAPLGAVPDVSLVSLQKGKSAAQVASAPMIVVDFTDSLDDLADTAALVDGLDLVITVDTAVAHLAGAMGKPVWLLNRWDSCWRWGLEGEASPWYPTMRVFRQSAPGDWVGVISRVAAALAAL